MINAVGNFREVTKIMFLLFKAEKVLNKSVNGRFVDNLDRKPNGFLTNKFLLCMCSNSHIC